MLRYRFVLLLPLLAGCAPSADPGGTARSLELVRQTMAQNTQLRQQIETLLQLQQLVGLVLVLVACALAVMFVLYVRRAAR